MMRPGTILTCTENGVRFMVTDSGNTKNLVCLNGVDEDGPVAGQMFSKDEIEPCIATEPGLDVWIRKIINKALEGGNF